MTDVVFWVFEPSFPGRLTPCMSPPPLPSSSSSSTCSCCGCNDGHNCNISQVNAVIIIRFENRCG